MFKKIIAWLTAESTTTFEHTYRHFTFDVIIDNEVIRITKNRWYDGTWKRYSYRFLSSDEPFDAPDGRVINKQQVKSVLLIEERVGFATITCCDNIWDKALAIPTYIDEEHITIRTES